MVIVYFRYTCTVLDTAVKIIDYLNNREFLSRNYQVIVAPLKFDVLKINICLRIQVKLVSI